MSLNLEDEMRELFNPEFQRMDLKMDILLMHIQFVSLLP
jgi:hypothetical protein